MKEMIKCFVQLLRLLVDCFLIEPLLRLLVDYFLIEQMGLGARKPVFGGLRTTKAQTSLRIRAV